MSRIVYLECREDNHNKFYLMTEDPTGTTFVARWGRIGTEKPYTRIHTPKVVYTRKGRRNGKEALV